MALSVGNREALLAGAKRCLYQKGFARTTSRDIAAESRVSLAAIVYHFGSKEALLTEALILAGEEWSQELATALMSDPGFSGSSLERFKATWERVIQLFATHRQLWAANFEVSPQIDSMPEVRRMLAAAHQQGRLGLAALFEGIDPTVDVVRAQTLGSFYFALLTGVMAQWIVDPVHAPTADDLVNSLKEIAVNFKTDGEIQPKSQKKQNNKLRRPQTLRR